MFFSFTGNQDVYIYKKCCFIDSRIGKSIGSGCSEQCLFLQMTAEPEFVKMFKKPGNRLRGINFASLCSLAARMITLFVVPARQDTKVVGIASSESIPGLRIKSCP
jgi:hypothetical protein